MLCDAPLKIIFVLFIVSKAHQMEIPGCLSCCCCCRVDCRKHMHTASMGFLFYFISLSLSSSSLTLQLQPESCYVLLLFFFCAWACWRSPHITATSSSSSSSCLKPVDDFYEVRIHFINIHHRLQSRRLSRLRAYIDTQSAAVSLARSLWRHVWPALRRVWRRHQSQASTMCCCYCRNWIARRERER